MRVAQQRVNPSHLNNLITALYQSPGLEELTLSNNQLKPFSGKLLAQILNLAPNLHSLNISDNSLGDRGGDVLINHLPTERLSVLILRNISIETKAVESLTSRFSLLSSLQVLDLSHNLLLDKGTTAVFSKMSLLPSLCYLILEEVGFTKLSK